MPRYPFLEYKLPLYEEHVGSWKREESRLYGGDAVLAELLRWQSETDPYYASRTAQASYLNFPKLHASTLTGHLSGETPMPEFGQMGKVRERSKLTEPSLAELLWYNVDGIGQDGTEMMPWFDGVQERALATGFRWILVEKPSDAMLREMRRTLRRPEDGKLMGDEVALGFRPYPVEYSPISVPFFQYTNGRLDFAVIRIPIAPASLVDATLNVVPFDQGYYLLVRQGFTGLGGEWAVGGWWKFDPDHNQVDAGNWDQTQGQIPMFQFVGEPSPGTTERPAMARSLTMELGQLAIGLMNRISERNWNITFSAKSINYVLGINPDEHAKVVEQHEAGSIMVGIPPVMLPDGKVGIPQIWNSSAAALDTPVFESVIRSTIEEAREIMVKQVTSTPDSSGRSKEAGFAEATSPLLARLAASRQQAMNTFLHFVGQRFGFDSPRASVTIPREFDLQPVVADIDATLSMLKRSWLRSPTWERELLLRAGEERGTLPEDERDAIEAELDESAKIATEPVSPLEEDEPEIPGRKPKVEKPPEEEAA